ncbi:class I SAM-dependent methyltransferase [Saliniramus fredricksonii]|uniref:Methyltransferase domain-containing protein n=1 Tax=Saliniramus fredricksonii TaxID=1653334 RepID=A0ABY0K6D0_9HYPH|nr:methyltransferase domain-containing protein [Saliniramus fredricksonii]SCC79451.1 Methyltransferase domain-containing protein [Saliniramus fredricksonii]
MVKKQAYDNVPGNLYDKYNTPNPIARRMVAGFRASFVDLVLRTHVKQVYEIGCGEGELSMELLRRGFDVFGSDLESSVIDIANDRSIAEGFGKRFIVADIYDVNPIDVSADLVVCCEVLEHLPDVGQALSVLGRMSRSWLLVSVPREPVWRILNVARGKYLGSLGNTPGHIQHWSSRKFLALLEDYVDIVEVRRPLPWTMVLCRPKRS